MPETVDRVTTQRRKSLSSRKAAEGKRLMQNEATNTDTHTDCYLVPPNHRGCSNFHTYSAPPCSPHPNAFLSHPAESLPVNPSPLPY